ncbi:Protein BFR2 [Smittium mucronatum]|uniref:Protein BFR2 n=1 Tax=Smittium mucronatum TaxID=133383 RepID=A0A1R0GTB3_9FUNG|nr:Protein BFR2 [Smittium mucronatum]
MSSLKGKSTLAKALMEITDPIPKDFDIENEYSQSDSESEDLNSSLSAKRAHYLPVTKGKIRNQIGSTPTDPKYAGVKGSRAQLGYSSKQTFLDSVNISKSGKSSKNTNDLQSNEDSEQSDFLDSEEEIDSSNEIDSENDLVSNDDIVSDNQSETAGDSDSFEENLSDPESNPSLPSSESSLKRTSKPKNKANKARGKFLDESSEKSDESNQNSMSDSSSEEESDIDSEDSAGSFSKEVADSEQVKKELQKLALGEQKLVSELAVSKESDVIKGNHVIKQTKIWESSLDLRIRFQKLLVKSNEYPTPTEFSEANINTFKGTELQSAVDSAKSCVFELQQKLLGLLDAISDKENIPNAQASKVPLKRTHDDVEALWQSIESRNKRIKSFRDSTLTKWDTRINLLPSSLSSKSLKAFKQSPLDQINSLLESKDRLLKRTHMSRINYSFIVPKLEIGEKSYLGIYDDTDFYQTLLHDLIDTKSQANSSKTIGSGLDAGLLKSVKNKQVDTKASKGRKIRYQVHEKLENFMAPSYLSGSSTIVPWTDQQVHELYSTLLGTRISSTTDNPQKTTTTTTSTTKLESEANSELSIGDFKLFNF